MPRVLSLLVVLLPALAFGAPPDGLRVAIVLDDSGSMLSTDPSRLSVTAAMIAAQLAGPGDRVGLVPLNGPVVPLRPGGAVAPLLANLRRFPRRQARTIYEPALRRALKLLAAERSGRKLILFLTDGEPDPPAVQAGEERFLRALPGLAAGVKMYAVVLGPLGQHWRGLLVQAATGTGGLSFNVAQSGDRLIEVFAAIYARQLGSRVVVRDLVDGKHSLAAMDEYVRYANVVVLSRRGPFSVSYPGLTGPRPVLEAGVDRGRPPPRVHHQVEKLRPRGGASLELQLSGGGSYRALLIWDYDLLLHLDAPVPDARGGYALSAWMSQRTAGQPRIDHEAFLRGMRVVPRTCQEGRCAEGEPLVLGCGGQGSAPRRCQFTGRFLPREPGTVQLDAVGRRQRQGTDVLELRSLERHTLVVPGQARLRAVSEPVTLRVDQNRGVAARACESWSVSAEGLPRAVPVRLDPSALGLPHGVTLRVEGSRDGRFLVGPGAPKRVQLCLATRDPVARPGYASEGRALRVVADQRQWFAPGGDEARQPVRVEITSRTWWNTYKRLLMLIGCALLLLLLLIWLLYGFISPHSFPETLKLNWGNTLERLDRNETPMDDIPRTSPGFYRNAQLWIGGPHCCVQSGQPALLRFEAIGRRGIAVLAESGVEVKRINKFDPDKRDAVASGSLVTLGDVYQVGDLYLRLKLG